MSSMSCRRRETKRRRLRERDGDRCWLCNGVMVFERINDPLNFRAATIDHVIPKAEGGGNELENLKLAHRTCNIRKGHKIIEETTP
jgi:5-methylcytosine-specific restriction endonuclease McrA